jgi:PST family polysaccharide transporter
VRLLATAASAKRRRLLANFVVLSLGEVAVRVLSFVFFLTMSRVAGPRGLGLFSVAAAFLAYAQVLSDGGLTVPAQRDLVRSPDEREAIVRRTLAAQLLLAVACMGVGTLTIWLVSQNGSSREVLLVLLPSLIVQALAIFYVFRAAEDAWTIVQARLLGQALATALGVSVLLAGGSVVVAAPAVWIGPLVAHAFLLRRAMRRWNISLAWRGPLLNAGLFPTVRRGGPYLGNAIMTQLLINADVIVVGLVLGNAAAGIYAAAYRIPAVIFMTVSIVVTAVFPELVRRAEASAGELQRAISTLISVSLLVLGPAIAMIVALAPELVRHLYGRRYEPSVSLLRILIAFVPLAFASTFIAQALVAAGRQVDYLKINAAAAVAALTLLIVGVPRWGLKSAAYSVTATEVVILIFLVLASRRLLGIRIAMDVLKAFLLLGVQVASLSALIMVLAVGKAVAIWAALFVAPSFVVVRVGGAALRNQFRATKDGGES